MKTVLNFLVRCYMMFTAFFSLVKVNFYGPIGGEWNSLLVIKTKREVFASLVAPWCHYTLLVASVVVVFTTKEVVSGLVATLTFMSSAMFLYRIAPNIIAWGRIMTVVHATTKAAQSTRCFDQVENNVKTQLKIQAKAVVWGVSDEDTASSALFNHSEWLARHLGFWRGERKSLFPK